MLAVIQTGGKQYLVKEGDTLRVEKLPEGKGKTIVFTDVLLAGEGKNVKFGTPLLKGGKVTAERLGEEKATKVTAIKHKKRKRYMRRFGHRQTHSLCKITKIEA